MSGTRFQFKVVGEGKVRARGELAFVLPQALDLVGKTAYTASISVDEQVPPGVVRLRGAGHGNVEAQYCPNPNRGKHKPPSWLDNIPNLGRQLGKVITWQAQP